MEKQFMKNTNFPIIEQFSLYEEVQIIVTNTSSYEKN